MNSLVELLEGSAARFPSRPAVAVPGGGTLTYAELSGHADLLRDRLVQLGVRQGDRVGMRLHKGLDAVISIFGILKAGAAYVPVDAESPAARGAFIHNDCQVKVVITEEPLVAAYRAELEQLGASPTIIALAGDEPALPAWLAAQQASSPAPAASTPAIGLDDIAYILYTSGSTGRPKGVVLTHGNALSFIDWCTETFDPVPEDSFSSHAPFHFDLSILDIYVPLKHGARLVLFGEALGKEPVKLAQTIANERISVWYSTPSILNFLSLYGKLDRYDYSALRMVFFAGEVFPVPQFRKLHEFWPAPRYFNLYGPTETNVCTYYEVPKDGSWEGMDTFPIGGICPPNRGLVLDENDRPVATGEPGELVVTGTNVMKGYWNLPAQNAKAFVQVDGAAWYRTGDIVSEGANGEYKYLNRRDRMVKRRGYRVELGEIEAGLLKHADIRESAVVSVPGSDGGVRIVAFVSCHADRKLGIIALKSVSAQNLPPYMIPDAFSVLDALPRTSTNKVDLQALKTLAQG